MRLWIFDTDGKLRKPKAELKASQSWQVGKTEGYEEDTRAHVIVTEYPMFGRLPGLFAPKSYQSMFCAATEWFPLRLDKGSRSHYRADRPNKKEQAARMMEVNQVNQAESNRMMALQPKEGSKETIFTWVTLGLLVLLIIQGIPLLLPAFQKAMGG